MTAAAWWQPVRIVEVPQEILWLGVLGRPGRSVIPTMIAFGLVLGRWWRPTLLLAAIVWPAILIAAGLVDVEAGLLTAAGLGALNAAVGILLHQAVLGLTRLGRRFTTR